MKKDKVIVKTRDEKLLPFITDDISRDFPNQDYKILVEYENLVPVYIFCIEVEEF